MPHFEGDLFTPFFRRATARRPILKQVLRFDRLRLVFLPTLNKSGRLPCLSRPPPERASYSRGFSDELGSGPFSKPAAFRQAPLGRRLNNSGAGSLARTCPLPQPTRLAISPIPPGKPCGSFRKCETRTAPQKATASTAEQQFLPYFQKPLCGWARLFFDTPCWSAFSSCWPDLYGGPETIPCRRILMAPHASGAVRILPDPISIGQPHSLILIAVHSSQTR